MKVEELAGQRERGKEDCGLVEGGRQIARRSKEGEGLEGSEGQRRREEEQMRARGSVEGGGGGLRAERGRARRISGRWSE